MASKIEDRQPKPRRDYARAVAWLLVAGNVFGVIAQSASRQWIMTFSHLVFAAVILFWLWVVQPHERLLKTRQEEIRKHAETFQEFLRNARRTEEQWPNSGTTTESNWKN
jgi:hypothetical protein